MDKVIVPDVLLSRNRPSLRYDLLMMGHGPTEYRLDGFAAGARLVDRSTRTG